MDTTGLDMLAFAATHAAYTTFDIEQGPSYLTPPPSPPSQAGWVEEHTHKIQAVGSNPRKRAFTSISEACEERKHQAKRQQMEPRHTPPSPPSTTPSPSPTLPELITKLSRRQQSQLRTETHLIDLITLQTSKSTQLATLRLHHGATHLDTNQVLRKEAKNLKHAVKCLHTKTQLAWRERAVKINKVEKAERALRMFENETVLAFVRGEIELLRVAVVRPSSSLEGQQQQQEEEEGNWLDEIDW